MENRSSHGRQSADRFLETHEKRQEVAIQELEQAREQNNKLSELRKKILSCSKCDLCSTMASTEHPDPGAVVLAGSPLMVVLSHPDEHDIDARRPPSEGRHVLFSALKYAGAVNVLCSSPFFAIQNYGVSIVPAIRCLPKEGGDHVRDQHVKACLPWLGQQIRTIKPKVIIGLGNVALAALTGAKLSDCHVSRVRGSPVEAPIPDTMLMFSIAPSFVVHHGHKNGGPSLHQLRGDLTTAWSLASSMKNAGKNTQEV